MGYKERFKQFVQDDKSRDNLKTTLEIYRNELKLYENTLKSKSGPDYDYNSDREVKTRFTIAKKLLNKADEALEDNDDISYMRYFYSSLRHQLPILAKLDTIENINRKTDDDHEQDIALDGGEIIFKNSKTKLSAVTDFLLIQVDDLNQPKIKERIQSIIQTPEGNRKETISIYELDNASRILHDEYILNHGSILILEQILRKLNIFLMFFLLSLLAVVSVLELLFNLNLPIQGFPLEGISTASGETLSRGKSTRVDGFLLYLYVIFIGIFGAIVSNLLKFYDVSAHTGPRMPDEEFQVVDEIIYARILIGGTAAAFLYTVLLSGVFLSNQFQPSALFVMVLAFTAGFSDRLLVKTLNSIEENVLIK